MELFIAGGCGEHGRNCFYVEHDEDAFLVDCGLLAGAEDDLPRLNAAQIQKLRAVFLTHSHADHTGALPWLVQQRYQRPIYATLPTLTQLPFSLNHIQTLESLCPCKGSGSVPELPGLQVSWGRSGHCAGSVWLRFEWNEKSILFSGDYAEHSPLYPCDLLRSQRADLAVLDAAYGSTNADWNICVKKLCVETVVLLSKGEINSKKVRVEFSLEDMDMSGFQNDATYGQIKERVLQQTGLKVSSLYIAQVKQKYGIIERENYNKPKSENAKQPKCPPEKEAAITEALKFFGMI